MRTGTVQQTEVNDKSGLVSCPILSLGGDSWFANKFQAHAPDGESGEAITVWAGSGATNARGN